MEKSKSEQDWHYAYWTFRTGTRPFEGVEMLIENMIENFEKVTSHSCGSYSTTNDLVARNAVSNTAIVMSYSFLEGFFHEEYEYYLKNKKPQKPKELSALICALLNEHNIRLTNWRNRRKKVDLLRVLRNAVVHCNGIIEDEIDRDKYKDAFGEDIFEWNENYPRLSLAKSLSLVRELKSIADEYAEKIFIGPNK